MKYNVKRIFLWTALGVLFFQHANSQYEMLYENWRWAHFTTEAGLPSNVVENVLEADDSTVWVSTPKGIAWYDGFRWNPVIVDSLFPQQRVRSIHRYHHSKIFAVLLGVIYIGDKNGFSKAAWAGDSYPGIATSPSAIDSESYLCVIGNDKKTKVLLIQKNEVKKIFPDKDGTLYKPSETIWFFGHAESGMFQYVNGRWTKVINNFGLNWAIRNIAENSLGAALFALDSPKDKIGLWFYNNRNFVYSVTERNQPIRTLDISNTGEIMVVYETGDVHVRNNTGKWQNIEPVPSQMVNTICVKYRSNNDVWFATDNGLYLLNRQKTAWNRNNHSFSDPRNIVFEIFKSREGDVWIGSNAGLEVHMKNGTKQFISSINGTPLGLVTGINQDNDNHIWVVSGDAAKGMFEWNGKQWHHYFPHGINFHKIRKDRSGNLWFLGLGRDSTDPAGYVLRQQSFLRIDSLYHLPSKRVYSFAENRQGTIWIGTLKGLVRIKNNQATYWGREVLGENAKIYTLAVDDSDLVWFSTFSTDLGTILPNDSLKWVWRKEETYEYAKKVWDLSLDEFGILWVATTSGLISYSNSVWSNFNADPGVTMRELRVVVPARDKILVGGHGIGVVSIDRNSSSIRIKTIVSATINENNDAYCSWESNSFWNKIASENIETRYKLDSGQWSDWSIVKNVTFNNLSGGNHSISVQAKDTYGTIYEAPAAAVFHVNFPVYMRPVFLGPFLILLLTLGIFARNYLTERRLHKINIERQRIRIANDLHDEIGSNLGSIALISQSMVRKKSLTRKMREELSVISETSLQTAEYLRAIVWYINPRYDTVVNLQTRLREIASRMVRDADIQFHINDAVGNDDALTDIRRNILLMFKEILHNIVKHSKATNVDIYFDRKQGQFQLLICDNGIGFDRQSEHYGNGLQSLKKRAEEIGALLEIKTELHKGTEVSIIFGKTTKTK